MKNKDRFNIKCHSELVSESLNYEMLKQVQHDKRQAFTLAEVLITLTIIGVIAALTIPNLMQKYQEQVTVNKVKKFYSTLTNAYAMAQKEYGVADEWGVRTNTSDNNAHKKVYELLFKPHFKILKNCGTNNSGDCIANVTYKFLNNSLNANYNNTNGYTYYSLILNDGSTVWFRGGDSTFIPIYFDVNGKKEPNKWGVDLFVFYIYYDNNEQISLRHAEETNIANSVNKYCLSQNAQGTSCQSWLIYKANMDYLHCSNLSWNGKNKCSK